MTLSGLTPEQLRQAASAAERVQKNELAAAFDPVRPQSRPTEQQLTILRDIGKIQYRYVVAGNQSGKSGLAAREVAWIVTGTHPFWTRPVEWGTGPLTIIIAGQDRRMMELELWGNKLSKFLDPAEWREVRAGQMLQHVEHRRTGDRIIFISHADSSEKNRKHMQGYVAHYVWLDEMPASIKILEELQRRVDSRNGYFLATFTPKFKNVEIKKLIEAVAEPIGKRYKLSKLDNPLFSPNREKEIAKLAGMSDQMKNAILFGDWMGGDDLVYEYVPELHGGSPPDTYSPGWRHVAVADPATESKLGLTIWAEDPASPIVEVKGRKSRTWWCVRAEYVEGIFVPTKIIAEVERRLTGLNIVERRADSHEGWFIRQAQEMGFTYKPIVGKNVPGRKDGLIRTFQESLGTQTRIADWCLLLIEEVQTCERDPTTGKIRGASRFHLTDTAHYFVDRIPEPSHSYQYATFEDRIYQAALIEERREQLQRSSYSRDGRRKHVIHADDSVEAPLPPLRQPGRVNRKSWRRTWKIS